MLYNACVLHFHRFSASDSTYSMVVISMDNARFSSSVTVAIGVFSWGIKKKLFVSSRMVSLSPTPSSEFMITKKLNRNFDKVRSFKSSRLQERNLCQFKGCSCYSHDDVMYVLIMFLAALYLLP